MTLNQIMPKHYYQFIGKRLNKNILTPAGVLCLPAYSLLSKHNLEQLFNQGVELQDSDIESELISLNRVVDIAVDEIRDIFKQAQKSDQWFVRIDHG